MEVHFSDHELRDLKKEQRLRREEKAARESKIAALLEMAEETIREERRYRRARTAVQGAAAELYARGVDVLCRGARAGTGAAAAPLSLRRTTSRSFPTRSCYRAASRCRRPPIQEEVGRTKRHKLEQRAAELNFSRRRLLRQHAAAL